MERYNHQEFLDSYLKDLSEREIKMREFPKSITLKQAEEIRSKLEKLGFVLCEAGEVTVGAEPLYCRLEGSRENESPKRIFEMDSFYIDKTTVTNKQYGKYDHKHIAPATSPGENHPATCMSYGRALNFVTKLNKATGMYFSIPTEPEITKAMAPNGWEYFYQENGEPDLQMQNVSMSYPEKYIEGKQMALEVDDPDVPRNHLGLFHPSGNVSVFTLGYSKLKGGRWGAEYDPSFVIIKGANFRTCKYSARVCTRGILDIASGVDTVGIRLSHPNPFNYVYED